MLKDTSRTEAYRRAILDNRTLFQNKVVLDVGCGTAILSFFCAQAGARKVYAVEASGLAQHAAAVVAHNKLSDRIIVIHSRVEDIALDRIEPVDIIVSEWMGYALLYECMLGSVLWARDRWLKPGGLMFPERAQLLVASYHDDDGYDDRVEFWRNVYGIDYSPMIPYAAQCACSEAAVEELLPEQQGSFPSVLLDLQLLSVPPSQLHATQSSFKLPSIVNGRLHGLVLWFDVFFPGGLRLSTSPEAEPTHWRQVLLPFIEPIEVQQDVVLEGRLTISPDPQLPRFLRLSLQLTTPRELVREYGLQ
jgi:protein arginine N-methyltransferase 6